MASTSRVSLDELEAALQSDSPQHVTSSQHRKNSLEERRMPNVGGVSLHRSNSVMDDLHLTLEGDSDCSSDLSSDADTFRVRIPSSRSSRRSSGIRVEDRSSEPGDNFAGDVLVRGYSTVGGTKTSGYIVYDIEIVTLKGTFVHIRRRYSEFVQLRNELKRLGHRPPRLPPKSGLAKYRPSFLERRSKHLMFWLRTVLLSPSMGGSEPAKEWCLSQYPQHKVDPGRFAVKSPFM